MSENSKMSLSQVEDAINSNSSSRNSSIIENYHRVVRSNESSFGEKNDESFDFNPEKYEDSTIIQARKVVLFCNTVFEVLQLISSKFLTTEKNTLATTYD